MQIERELMRSCLLEALRRNPRTQYENLKYEVATVAAERGLAIQVAANRQPTLPQADFRRLRETISSLITEGVMTAGMDDSNPAWPFVSLTEYGEEFVLNQRATPHDRAEYLDRLRNAGALDDIDRLDPDRAGRAE